ncbi:MAG: hypothetical protein QOF11_1699, partial [Chloroflexota bacterium]|nr:hypothetical protein [Chloroflexota bacterium]
MSRTETNPIADGAVRVAARVPRAFLAPVLGAVVVIAVQLASAGGGASPSDVDGIRLSATASAKGSGVQIETMVTNSRSTEALVRFDCGSAVKAFVTVPVPNTTDGRTWSGVAGEFKNAALTMGTG